MEIAFGSHPDDVYHVDEVGYLQLGQHPSPGARGRRGRVHRGQPARRARRTGGRHDPRRRTSGPASSCRAIATSSRWCSPGSTRPTPTSTRACATRWRSSCSTTRACTTSPRSSTALGFGFRCGFLGLLHMEIVQERLEREFNLDLITTVPTVELPRVPDRRRHAPAGEPDANLPDPAEIDRIDEPYVKARIMAPADYIGGDHEAGPGAAGRVQRHALHRHRPGWSSISSSRWARSCSISTTSSSRSPGATPRSTTRWPATATRDLVQARHADQRRSDRRLQRHHPPRQGAASAAARWRRSSRS